MAQTGKAARKARSGPPGWASVLVSAVAIWLGWQVILGPVSQRAPPALIARLNPGSPLVLRRAAEVELQEDRNADAEALAQHVLSMSPFDVRALRVAGLSAARLGREDQADEILTLAGNWSLRDDPAHIWLIGRRLRQGNYGSAFAHADTLARRGRYQEHMFRMFTTAAQQDPRAVPVVASLLEARPPWQEAYFDSLYQSPRGVQLAAAFTQILEQRSKPLNDAELRRLYYWLLQNASPRAAAVLRERLGRPAVQPGVIVNGGFDQPDAIEPFQWRMGQMAGLTAGAELGSGGDPALRIAYEGLGAEGLTEQFVALPSGAVTLSGLVREETTDSARSMEWKLVCLDGAGARRPSNVSMGAPDDRGWRSFTARFDIPTNGCTGQTLRLDALPSSGRTAVVVWYDKLSLG